MSDKQEIVDTIKAATSYLSHLKALIADIQAAEEQICQTSKHAQLDIEEAFNDLTTGILQMLNERKHSLINKAKKTQQQSLEPLEQCRADVTRRISKTEQFIAQGSSLLNGHLNSPENFTKKSSFLGSLPEIPELKEVPFLTFQLDTSTKKELIELCSRFGEVSKIAPVQISQTVEKPGGILVEWQIAENDDRTIDIQEFRLQRAFGNVNKQPHLEANFQDCFMGLDNQYLVKDLRVHQEYSFRVCCKFEGALEWSPWSLPYIGVTSIQAFSWEQNADFALADENRIATPVKNSPALLLSHGPQFAIGYSIEFTFLEFDTKLSTLALVVSNNGKPHKINTEHKTYFALNSNGEINVNGVKKSTKLPPITKGLKVGFTCEAIGENHTRINIDVCEKRVTYDWNLSSNDHIYFVAQLQSPNTKIMVE